MTSPSSSSHAQTSVYAQAGVDIDVAEATKKRIAKEARATFRPGVLGDIGFFGGLFQLQGYQQPVLVASTDGVGTKLKVAALYGRHDTVGIDLVNHCVNDILTLGAEPLFFLDYIGAGVLEPDKTVDMVKGMAQACKAANCALIGGETATMPGLYAPGDYDLVGFIVGVVERPRIIDGSSIKAGDVILGLPSSGLHTNGYSLARKAFGIDANPKVLHEHVPELGRTLGEALLEPHKCYLHELRPALARVKGMAHITGGGLLDNVPRVLPKGVAARFDQQAWEAPPLFRLIQRKGGVSTHEMYRVFNMGIGMCVFCSPEDAKGLALSLPGAKPIGEVVAQTGAERVTIGGTHSA